MSSPALLAAVQPVSFSLVADPSEGGLHRILAPFAKRGLVISAMRVVRDDSRWRVVIRVDAMDGATRHGVEADLRRVLDVARTEVTLHPGARGRNGVAPRPI
ncbi:MAG: hypothetical protein ACU0B1_10470 [Thermohalobaculum sp.]